MRDLNILRAIDQLVLQGRELDAFLPDALADAARALDADAAALFVKEGDALVLRGVWGATGVPLGTSYSAHETFGGRAIHESRILTVDDVSALPPDRQPSPFVALTATQAFLVAPLVVGGVATGLLGILSRAPRAWAPRDQLVVELISDRLAAAVHTSRSHEAERHARSLADAMERRFQTVWEHALDGIILVGDDLRIVDVNPAACRILGRPREVIVGALAPDLMPAAEREIAPARMGELVTAGAMRGEGRLVLPDGTLRQLEYGSVANVSPGVHLTLFRDIEDRKRAEEAARFLDEASGLLATSLDYDETLASVVRLAVPRVSDWAAVDMLDPDGSLRRVAVAHVDPEKVALAHELWRQQRPTLADPTGAGAVMRTGQAELVELVTDDMLVAALRDRPATLDLVRALGLVSGMTVPLHARGRAVGSISFVSAESRRRFGQRDLAFAEELARRAGHAIENALFVRELREANAAKDLFLRRAEHLQATASALVRAESTEDIARELDTTDHVAPLGAHGCVLYERTGSALTLLAATSAFRGAVESWSSVAIEGDVPVAKAARERQALWLSDEADVEHAFPGLRGATNPAVASRAVLPLVVGDACIGVLGVTFGNRRAFDADERSYLMAVANLWGQALHRSRLAQAERDALRRVLEAEAAATRKKDEFLAMLGHELRNPLAPIVTATSLIRVRGRATSRELEILDRQARHLVRLVDDLLDISRVTSGKLHLKRALVEVSDVVAHSVENTAQTFDERRVRLYPGVVAPDFVVDADRDRLVQVLTNLLVNAAKFTPSGKSVFLDVRRDGGEVLISVRDEGEGISPELLPRVFDVFTQGDQASDRRAGGLGLGLAIARSIVVAHGGTVEAASPGVGRGATFTVRLPLVRTATAPGAFEEAERPPSLVAPSRGRVLVVDDNVDGAELIAEFLREVGYETQIAPDAREALALARSSPPDAAVLDIGLPDIDGYELARRLREELGGRAPKMVAVTGYAQESDRERALAQGFAEHFAKPVDMTKLARTLNALLAP